MTKKTTTKKEFKVLDQGFEDAETISTTHTMNAVAKVKFDGHVFSVPYRYMESYLEGSCGDTTRAIDEILYEEIECDDPDDGEDSNIEAGRHSALFELLNNQKKNAEDLLWK
jgi:hypothetical protein